ncbi:MAG: hydrogenase/urease accessory protein HupE [Maribacter sp.]|jgi:hydrogenase/urease accessory protein HupE
MKNISLLFIFVLATLAASAHEVRPAYFSVTQLTDSTYQVVWKIPAMGNAIPKIYPVLPENWIITEERSNLLPGNLRRTYTIRVDKNIEGNELYFEGQEKTLIDILVSIKKSDGIQYSAMLKPSNPHYKIPLKPDRFSTIKTYLLLGVEHILFGIDHLLFVLALLLLTKGFRKIVKTITAFTIAHSITLSLAALGFIGLPGAPVEAVIALSIVFLAVELIHYYNGRKGLTVRYPWVVAFTFGLLHGFGFAGALIDLGLPQTDIPWALLFFNVGVEIGQIAFVIGAIGCIWLLSKIKISWPIWIKKVPPYAIGSLAAFWLIERIYVFF